MAPPRTNTTNDPSGLPSDPKPFLGYGRQCIDEDDERAVLAVLRGDYLTQGPAVEAFEDALCRATGAPRAVAVSSGTAALQLAYRILGVERGSVVWVPANTFLASATTALHAGARVELLDVDHETGNLDVGELERRLEEGPVPDVVCVVHFAGLACDMQRLIDLKRRHGFAILEDAAHALGASYLVDGRAFGPGSHPAIDAACLSFHPVKTITTGEGGAVLVPDSSSAARLRRLRSHGVARDYSTDVPFAPMLELGWNARLSDLHAALGASQLTKLEAFVERRNALAERYAHGLAGLADVQLPSTAPAGERHAWHLFVLRVQEHERGPLVAYLRERGIGTQLHYAPLSWHPWFRTHLQARVPAAEAHARRALSLPLHPGLRDVDVDRVVEALASWRQAPARCA